MFVRVVYVSKEANAQVRNAFNGVISVQTNSNKIVEWCIYDDFIKMNIAQSFKFIYVSNCFINRIIIKPSQDVRLENLLGFHFIK